MSGSKSSTGEMGKNGGEPNSPLRMPDVGGVRLAAAPQPDVQAVGRPAVRRQGARYRWSLPFAAEPGACSQRSRRGSPAGRIITCTSRRLRHHGSIRSSAGLQSLPESSSGAAFIPRSGTCKPTSAPSSIGTTKTQSPSNGPSQPTKYSPRSSASAKRHSRHYAANFRFT